MSILTPRLPGVAADAGNDPIEIARLAALAAVLPPGAAAAKGAPPEKTRTRTHPSKRFASAFRSAARPVPGTRQAHRRRGREADRRESQHRERPSQPNDEGRAHGAKRRWPGNVVHVALSRSSTGEIPCWRGITRSESGGFPPIDDSASLPAKRNQCAMIRTGMQTGRKWWG